MRSLPALVLPVAAALTVAGSPAPASGADVSVPHLYGKRYCEYLVVGTATPVTAGTLKAEIWNTFGVNTCPQDLWGAIGEKGLERALGARLVRRNGPRFWLIDKVRIEIGPGLAELMTFPNGLTMRHVASVPVPTIDGAPDVRPYRELRVRRTTTFTWRHSRRIHELISPAGRVYVMQAYANIVDRDLTAGELTGLGSRLRLPPGWRYRSRSLRHDLALSTKGNATVLQDDLQNTYQRER